MSFLDNLENSLKSLESREERDPGERKRRESDRARALAAGPWADRLKTSDYTKKLLDEAARAAHEVRAKLYITWIESVLRLDLRTRRLELRPTPDGIIAVFLDNGTEQRTDPVDLESNPSDLVRAWL